MATSQDSANAGHPGDVTNTAPAAVAGLLHEAGIHRDRVRAVLALVAEGPVTLADAVRLTAVPRRTVEELWAALGPDLDRTSRRGEEETFRLRPGSVARYRPLLGRVARPPSEPRQPGFEDHADLVATTTEDIASGPPPLPHLDHVPATPTSVVNRALWLHRCYDLGDARVTFLGDHDLTSLALSALCPNLPITVVDLDERVLEHIDTLATRRGLGVRCLHADLRFGLPPTAVRQADLVFTDPPYTEEGIGLFAARGVEALRSSSGRLVVAYGHSARTPRLGWTVQRQLGRLGLLFEAILPDFDRYVGAQAIGSSSDLYVCRPVSGAGRRPPETANNIYTHGAQSVEAGGRSAERAADWASRLRDLVDAPDDDSAPRRVDWSEPVRSPGGVLLADATGDQGFGPLRILLAASADRVAVLVPDGHPDVVDARGQRRLADLLEGRYQLRFHRGVPGRGQAVIAATPVEDPARPEERTVAEGEWCARQLLRRAHGRVDNVWREALIRRRAADGVTLNKKEARELVRRSAPHREDLTERLIDLPRHRLAALLAAVRAC
ncbi:bis-aminopropyl spermidine synthase family protein [Actinoalloteichus spitiensis]|uniref:bis-aminopropyl spermidine synthase family protein n=1 Tax=Actinoalloteichus spitiensis TaxID=252394 RepID=UPI000474EEF2|nr:bis-aminopropyl spermidine synthase family protein [Actinoalloteichus spitiensis]